MTRIDITGQRFGRLIALHPDPERSARRQHWVVQCDCGMVFSTQSHHLRGGRSKSCGCARRDTLKRLMTKHGEARKGHKSMLYHVWQQMLRRCHTPSHESWEYYGGRGISVCERWRHDFAAFKTDVAQRPSMQHSLDRIDNDGNYEPANVRWATRQQQAQNQRTVADLEKVKRERDLLFEACQRAHLCLSDIGGELRARELLEAALQTLFLKKCNAFRAYCQAKAEEAHGLRLPILAREWDHLGRGLEGAIGNQVRAFRDDSLATEERLGIQGESKS